MAYYITDTVRMLLRNSHYQTANIVFEGLYESYELTEADIVENGLSVNRYSATGSSIGLGSVSAAELTLKLNNSDGRFDSVVFEGGELYVTINVVDQCDPENLHPVPLGYFTIDEAPRKSAIITLKALDRMVQFDYEADDSMLIYPSTAQDMLKRICNINNIALATDLTSLVNQDYEINAAPVIIGARPTWRQYLSWLAQLMGSCAYINRNGLLELQWYTACGEMIDKSDRYSSDLSEQAITITGVQVIANDTTVLMGDRNYVLNISGNGFLTHDVDIVARALYERLGGFTYTPFSATTVPMPHLEPMDMITYIDGQGIEHTTVITEITFTMNSNTQLVGIGETAVRSGWATGNPLTQREQMIIQTMINTTNEKQSAAIQSALAFNETISNALGLHVTGIKQPNGSTIYYLHDHSTLDTSMNIFTMTSKGIAWTTEGWKDGEPVWSYGITSAGDALFKMLTATGVTIDDGINPYRIEMTPKSFRIFYKDMPVTLIDVDQMTIPNLNIVNYASVGKIKAVPYIKDGILLGTNIVFMD